MKTNRSFYRHPVWGVVELVGKLFENTDSECLGMQDASDSIYCFTGDINLLVELPANHPHVVEMLKNRERFMEQKAIWAETQQDLI